MPDVSGVFGSARLRVAVQQTLDTANVADTHSVVAFVDQDGAHVGIATRQGTSWRFSMDAGYQWSKEAHGFTGELRISHTW